MPEAPMTKPQTAAHGVKVKTMSNFYTQQHLDEFRPGSANIEPPKARIVSPEKLYLSRLISS